MVTSLVPSTIELSTAPMKNFCCVCPSTKTILEGSNNASAKSAFSKSVTLLLKLSNLRITADVA